MGGGFLNGTAEYTFTSGVAWGMQAGVGYALSLVVGGLVFARVMRRHGFATLIDPSFANESSSFANYVSDDPAVKGWAGLGFVLVMAAHSYGVILTKKLTKITSVQLNFHQGLMIGLASSTLVPLFLHS